MSVLQEKIRVYSEKELNLEKKDEQVFFFYYSLGYFKINSHKSYEKENTLNRIPFETSIVE